MDKAEYWADLAKYDLVTAQAMLTTKRFLYVGFMCHQAIEKILKAYYAKTLNESTPYTHNLTLLSEKSGLYRLMNDSQKDFLDFLEPLNVEARYPTSKDVLLSILTEDRCIRLLEQTEGELAWVMKKFS